jgi:ABC-type cobalt transport system substrate-binding protein
MKHHLLNALLIIMVITLVLIPVIGINTGPSSGKDTPASARAEGVPTAGEAEL